MSNIIGLKLVSGEEVLCKVDNEQLKLLEDDTKQGKDIIIQSPRVVQIQMGRDGLAGLVLIPFMVSNQEGHVYIKKSGIIATNYNIPKQLEDGYLQQTSGIQLA